MANLNITLSTHMIYLSGVSCCAEPFEEESKRYDFDNDYA